MVKHLAPLILIALLGVYGCYVQDVEVESMEYQEELVIYCILSTQEEPFIKIYSNFPASSQSASYDQLFIMNAKGRLFEDGRMVDSIVHDRQNKYVFAQATEIKPGHYYQIEISAPGFSSAISEVVQVPERLPHMEFAFDSTLCTQLYNNFTGCALTITFPTDHSSDLLFDFAPSPTLSSSTFPKVIEVEGGGVLCSESGYENLRVVPQSCHPFEKIAYYLPYQVQGSGGEIETYEKYSIHYGSISRSYFEYIENFSQQFEYSYSILFEPVITYSNFEGASGFFGTINDTTFVLEL